MCGVAGEGSRERVSRADPGNSNLKRTLKAAQKRLKRVRCEAIQRSSRNSLSQLEVCIKDGNQAGFYKQLKGMDLEGSRSCSVQYIKDEEGRLLRDSFVIGGCSGSALYSIRSRQRST